MTEGERQQAEAKILSAFDEQTAGTKPYVIFAFWFIVALITAGAIFLIYTILK